MTRSTILRLAWRGLLLLLGINLLYILLIGPYDFWIGPAHLIATTIFKPLRWFNTTAIVLIILAATTSPNQSETHEGVPENNNWFAVALLILICATYYQTFAVNLHVFEWDHREMSARLQSPRDFLHLFLAPQPNNFYRPITFISLWFDYVLFRSHLWAYHLQNLFIHFLNSLVVLKLGSEFGLGNRVSRWAALLFSVAAINFEAVMWPAARFDLLATLFTLLATLFFLRYQKRYSRSYLWLALACFVLGVLSKESAYCFPLTAALLTLPFGDFSASHLSRQKRVYAVYAILAVVLVGALLVGMRLAMGLGGYRNVSGGSLHLQIDAASVFSFLVNTAGLTPLAVNSSVALPLYVKVAVAAFVVAMITMLLTTRSFRKKVSLFLALLFVSAVPVFTLVGWLRPSLQNSRFLYLPAVWICFVLAVTIGARSRYAMPILVLLVMSNSFAAHYNVAVYREMLTKTDYLADQVFQEQKRMPAATIFLTGLPEAPNGVFYFPSELAFKVKTRLPDVNVVLLLPEEPPPAGGNGKRIYKWDATESVLALQP
jgi:hypothetical protein